MKFTGKLIIFIFTFLVLAVSAHAAEDGTLFEAVKKGDKAAVEALLAKGADVNAKEKDSVGESPLHSAVLGGHKDAVALLLDQDTAVNAQLLEWNGQYGGPVDAGHRVVVDANGWTRLWRLLGQEYAPPLDFTKYFAVAVMVGERPTGGYTVEFLDPMPKGVDVTVRYRVRAPTGFTTQALAQPWKVRAFPRVKGKMYVEALTNETTPK